MRNAFDGLRLDMGERGIPELEVISGNLWGCKTASKNTRLGETVLTSACFQYSRHTRAGSTGQVLVPTAVWQTGGLSQSPGLGSGEALFVIMLWGFAVQMPLECCVSQDPRSVHTTGRKTRCPFPLLMWVCQGNH